MWSVVICDDEPEVAGLLRRRITEIEAEHEYNIYVYSSGKNLIYDLKEGNIKADIAFIDVNLGKENGVRIAARALEINPMMQIVFISDRGDYSSDVYEVDHVYYILKPLSNEYLTRALRRATEKASKAEKKCFYISTRKGCFVIPFNEIYSFEKDKRKIVVNTVSGENYSFYGKFDELVLKLDDRFIRCHNSYIANIEKVMCLEKQSMEIENGNKIPVSRTYSREVRKRFREHVESLTNQ